MRVAGDVRQWDEAPLDDVIDHIIAAYHRPLLALIDTLGETARAERTSDPRERAHRALVVELVTSLRELLVEHMRKEEELVFPWLRTRNRATAGLVINLLEREHDEIVRYLGEIRDLLPRHPSDDGGLARATDELTGALREHLYLENDVLFPRALAFEPSSG